MTNTNDSIPRRALGLADILILVAATAVALAWLRKPLEYRLTFVSDGRIIENLRPSTLVGAAFAATWGLGVMAIRLRLPKPRGSRWSYRPGFVACAASTLAGVAKLAARLKIGRAHV